MTSAFSSMLVTKPPGFSQVPAPIKGETRGRQRGCAPRRAFDRCLNLEFHGSRIELADEYVLDDALPKGGILEVGGVHVRLPRHVFWCDTLAH
jgi:hypothetical protein